MKRVEDINVVRIQSLSPSETLKAELPASEKANRTVTEGRKAIRRVLHKDDSRLLVITGPCSVHDAELALEAVPFHPRHRETLGVVDRETLESRLRLFCTAYGADSKTVLQHVPAYMQMVMRDIHKLSAQGLEPFVSFNEGGIPEALE